MDEKQTRIIKGTEHPEERYPFAGSKDLVEKVALIIRQNTRPYESLRDGKTITAEEIAKALIPLIVEEIKRELEKGRISGRQIVKIPIKTWDKFWERYGC